MKKINKITDNNTTAHSTPSPPIFQSPAHGYSKSILSAIKSIPYEPSSGSRSSINSSTISPPNIIRNNNQNTEHGIRRTETTILKIKVGQFNEDEENKMAQKKLIKEKAEELTTVENKKRRERRSISCETAISPMAQPDKNRMSNSSKSIQKTQSVNMVNMVTSARQQPLPLIVSPLPGCSITSSTHSIQSTSAASTAPTPTNEGRIHRSPSASSSYCSKEDKSTTESHGAGMLKIPITIFVKALDACANGRLQELHQLIGEYPELITYQYSNCLRLSCLHIAAKAGDIVIAKFLLKSGANVNAKDDTWATPLHFAAKAGQFEMVRFLCEKGAADSTIFDAHGRLYNAYLPATGHRKQIQSAELKPSKTNRQWDLCAEEDLSNFGNGGHSQNSLTFAPSRFNSFSSFRKPISRMRDLLYRK